MTLSIIDKAEELSTANTQLRKEQRRSKNEILYERQMWGILKSQASGSKKLEMLEGLATLSNDPEIRKSVTLIHLVARGLYDVETLEKMSVEPARRLQKSYSHNENRFEAFSEEERAVIEAALKAFRQSN